MFRTPLIAALTAVLLGGTALAQPATAPPAGLSGAARSAPDFDDNDRDYGPPVSEHQANPRAQATANEQRDRDIFCRRDAAARTNYTNPRDAARDEQVRGSIGGTLGGAALGAIIGGASGDAGTGAAIGAGAGLLAGTAVGSSNARQAARDVEADYSAAYYACMHQADSGPRSAYSYDDRGYDDRPPYDYDRGYGPDYAYGPPPPPYYRPYYPPAYAPYYGPNISLGFAFGGGHRGWGHNRGFRGGYGGRGGWRHR
jgi:uncharacterized protein YcfJ